MKSSLPLPRPPSRACPPTASASPSPPFGTDNAIYVEDLPADLENITKAKEHVAERIGFAKKHLDGIETQAAATLAQLKADHDAIIAGIEVSTPVAQTTPANETAAQ